MVGTPPMKTEEQLQAMDRDELVQYAMERQDEAYKYWEAAMGRDL